ncbi:hypothetical protein FXN65_23945 [Metapseudomonas lalkuanensis]|uniref:Lipoprotein n=1 Tax=Metapseudomonas lalkuanensis TaxID=2604832 RepID=A0A5J6QT91_9GAMM|nr:hypothetical protein [Pseudomonas lalkuanensis]QEY64962.1 hypothetical protein FXN65_23945 [Pseudomonas lalkuanensis]
MRTQALGLLVVLLSGCDSEASRVEDLVRENLKDPTSAQFKEIRKSKDGTYFCGEVNAKNSMGGYTGFTGFAVGPMDSSFPDVSFEINAVMDRCYDLPPIEVHATE